ncbi:hypothetical protein Tco_0702761 [Tanacetum coccineum]|uniref:Uncharacterized protein n=1 Tax=Tanacetum coccineum TaxID=301880 RepID=A0ABQ4XY04_9ASTR
MGGSLLPDSLLIAFPPGKDAKRLQRYPGVPTTPWRISIRSMDSFLGLVPKSPSSWHRQLAPRNLHLCGDFMIVEEISSIIDPRLSQVVLGRPFIEMSNMTHDPPEGVVRFTKEKEHTKSVYLRNDEDKRRGVEYVMSKILGFYKECLELGPEYLTGMDDEGEVTLYLMRRSLEVLRKFYWMILAGRFNQLSHVSSLLLSKPGEY